MSRIHPVFHVSKLKSYRDGSASFPDRPIAVTRPPAELLDDTNEQAWEVDRVVNKRQRRVKRGCTTRTITEYLVLWKGYPDYEATWETTHNLRYANDAVRAYEQSVQ